MSSRTNAKSPPLKERLRETVATAIVDAVEEVASERGIDATSIASIAARAGVAVGTLYNYYPDRDALFAALFARRRETLLPRLSAANAATRALAPEPRLRGYLAAVVDTFEEARRFCRIAMSDDHTVLKVRNPKSALMPLVTQTVTEILTPLLNDGAPEHARMLVGALKAAVQWRIEHDEPLRPAADLLVNAFLHGIKR